MLGVDVIWIHIQTNPMVKTKTKHVLCNQRNSNTVWIFDGIREYHFLLGGKDTVILIMFKKEFLLFLDAY